MKLLPVCVAEDLEPSKAAAERAVPKRCGVIHIDPPGAVRISLEGSVDPAVVRAVLKSLHA